MYDLDAMRAALRSYNQPRQSPRPPQLAFPTGMLVVIKAAAGDATTITYLAEALGQDEKMLREAASFYLQQHLLSTSTPLRRLGLTERATQDDITQHKRWLLKWLHPDLNRNKWQSSMFSSMTAAADEARVIVDRAAKEIVAAQPITSAAESGDAIVRPVIHRRRPSRVSARKRVRVILWREMLWRVARRAGVVVAVASVAYVGATQFKRVEMQRSWAPYHIWGK